MRSCPIRKIRYDCWPANRVPACRLAHETYPRHRNRCERSGVIPGRSAVSRQSDVGVKVRVQSLISTEAHKKTRVAIGSNRENAGFACRGVGHTARGRETPRELHLADVRLLYLISPRVLEGHWVSLLYGARRRGVMCILTHKRSCVRKRIWTSVDELRDSWRNYAMYRVLQLCHSIQLQFRDTAYNRSLYQICHFRRSCERDMATIFQKETLAILLNIHILSSSRTWAHHGLAHLLSV